MTFDEWMYQQQKYSTREERLYDDIDMITGVAKTPIESIRSKNIILGWLKAAYNVGHEHATTQHQDDGK
jgi:hypothetical protein